MNSVIVQTSRRIATAIHNANPEETSSVDRLTALLALRFLNYGVVTLALIIGVITNSFFETFLAVVAVVFLRIQTGGYHFPTLDICFVCSTIILSVIPHINTNQTVLLNTMSIILILVFSEKNRLLPAVFIVLNFWTDSSVISVAAFVQALSLIKWRR